ncbi:MAG: hypothetical protein JO293_05585 [Candidatus Eremiobacteraeota bacterium]|nr:hypothetical protein [Candidatus Eremiobacteraeota bacterium]MBV8222812.1 hypothetical protein [Candidatus Eremiobacteraeota bacterium]
MDQTVPVVPVHEDLINEPYADVHTDGERFIRVLTPPRPSAGVGELRVVRAVETSRGTEFVLTYTDFVRL